MQELQSFLWLILGIVILFILFRLVKAVFKWVLFVVLIAILLYYYEPTRHWLNQVFVNLRR